jgi:hypothetical protein
MLIQIQVPGDILQIEEASDLFSLFYCLFLIPIIPQSFPWCFSPSHDHFLVFSTDPTFLDQTHFSSTPRRITITTSVQTSLLTSFQGTIIPADGRVVTEDAFLQIDQSSITGESLAVDKVSQTQTNMCKHSNTDLNSAHWRCCLRIKLM